MFVKWGKKCRATWRAMDDALRSLKSLARSFLSRRRADDEHQVSSLMWTAKRRTHLRPTNNSCLYLLYPLIPFFFLLTAVLGCLLMLSFALQSTSNSSSCQKNPRNSFQDERGGRGDDPPSLPFTSVPLRNLMGRGRPMIAHELFLSSSSLRCIDMNSLGKKI